MLEKRFVRLIWQTCFVIISFIALLYSIYYYFIYLPVHVHCTAHEISIIILLTVPARLKQEFVVELQQMTRTVHVVIQVAHCKEWAETPMPE
jgi:hypothetical protein